MFTCSKHCLKFMIVMAMFSSPASTLAQEMRATEQMSAMSFGVRDLPVWGLNESNKPRFDPSILVSHIKKEVSPELWASGRARIIPSAPNESLIILVPENEFSKVTARISSLLKKMRDFSEHDVKRRLAKNLELASLGGERVILLCTQADSVFYSNFIRAINKHPKLSKLFSENYIVQCVKSSKTKDLEELGVNTPVEQGARFLILDSIGRPFARKEFERWDKETADELAHFAQSNVKAFADAKMILDNGLAEAKKRNKKLLVQMSGPACGPCIMLARYLDANKKLIGKEFVHIKLDRRMVNATEIKKKYGARFDTIPWMVILSPTGELIIDGMSPQGNIAFPRADFQTAHFKKMLTSTSENLSETEISSLLESLDKLANPKKD